MKKINTWLNSLIRAIDTLPLHRLGLLIVAVIISPIVYLGENAVFPIHDQLDETILNYVFTARYWGQDTFEAMMCGATDATGLKPFAPIFVLLYLALKPYTAFIIQYCIVVITAWFGTYAAVKLITKSSVSALFVATAFSLLPFRSVYGNLLAGIPLLVYCILKIRNAETTKSVKIICYIGIAYFTVSTSLVLIGYAVLTVLGILLIIELIKNKRADLNILFPIIFMSVIYILLNLDIIGQFLGKDGVVSHRTEFVISGTPFLEGLKTYLIDGVGLNESLHKYIYVALVPAIVIAILHRNNQNSLLKQLVFFMILTFAIAVISAFCGSETVANWRNAQTGMLKSFQWQRFYLILPGLWYILLGISLAVILKELTQNVLILNLSVGCIAYAFTLLYVAKYQDSIFYQNVNQINNSDITGYITWEKLYADDLMTRIENDIGMDMTTYRVGSIGISPVVSLMHGFYTIDGYSNNYSLEYKHEFADVIKGELDKNDFLATYFYDWGNRCYLFYHEWGNYYLMGKASNAVISDFSFDTEAMKSMNCKYIFSAGEIENPDEHGLKLFGTYESDSSYWRIWVYELQ